MFKSAWNEITNQTKFPLIELNVDHILIMTYPELDKEKRSSWTLVVQILETALTFREFVVNLPDVDRLQRVERTALTRCR